MQQSTPPWRVFDTAAADGVGGTSQSQSGAPGLLPPTLGQPNLLLAAAGLAGALLIGGVALAVAIGGSGAATVAGPETGHGAFASPGDSVEVEGQIVVDVTGAVVDPGLYRLATGARVGDAIDAAGGFSPRVDVDRVGLELNLATTLADGDQVRVPSRDDPSTHPGAPDGTGNGSANAGLVDLNAATQAELEALPGIGPVTARKIIAARTELPFRSVDDLRERGLVGEKTFSQIRSLITAG